MEFYRRLRQIRDFKNQAVEIVEGFGRFDQELFNKIQAMSHEQVESFLSTLKKEKVSHARMIISFIQRSNDYESCRDALTLSGLMKL